MQPKPTARSVDHMLIDPFRSQRCSNMLSDIEALLATTTPLPDNRTARCLELLAAAKALTGDILKRAHRIH